MFTSEHTFQERADRAHKWLAPLALPVEAKLEDGYYLAESDDEGLNYCHACACERANELGGKVCVSRATLDDMDTYIACEDCGARLKCSLSEYGARDVAEERLGKRFSRDHFTRYPGEAHLAQLVLKYIMYYWPTDGRIEREVTGRPVYRLLKRIERQMPRENDAEQGAMSQQA